MYKIWYEEWDCFEGVTEEGFLGLEFEFHSEAERWIQKHVEEIYDYNGSHIVGVFYSDEDDEEYGVRIEYDDFSNSDISYTIKEVA